MNLRCYDRAGRLPSIVVYIYGNHVCHNACVSFACFQDFKIFELIDIDNDGNITRNEWHDWLKRTHASKGKKGDTWLARILHTLMHNMDLAIATTNPSQSPHDTHDTQDTQDKDGSRASELICERHARQERQERQEQALPQSQQLHGTSGGEFGGEGHGADAGGRRAEVMAGDDGLRLGYTGGSAGKTTEHSSS